MSLTRKEKEQQARRQYILDAAKTVFARDGYERASMNEIAKLSEFTKRTLYQYFEDKADLYLSTLLSLSDEMIKTLKAKEYRYKNGYDWMKQYIEDYYIYFKSNQDTFKIMYDIGKVRTLTKNKKILDFLKHDQKITIFIQKIISTGQKDGTISTEQEEYTTAINIKFLLTAIFDKLITTGKSYSKHIGKSEDEFSNALLEIVLKTLKP